MREIPYSEGDRGRSRRYDRRDDDEMYDRIMDYIESRGRGRSSRSMSPRNEIGSVEILVEMKNIVKMMIVIL